jgi:hypothetical protein
MLRELHAFQWGSDPSFELQNSNFDVNLLILLHYESKKVKAVKAQACYARLWAKILTIFLLFFVVL